MVKNIKKICSGILILTLVLGIISPAAVEAADSVATLNEDIAEYSYFTSEDTEDLQDLVDRYNVLGTPDGVVGIDRIQTALAKFQDGVYFYDDFEGYSAENPISDAYEAKRAGSASHAMTVEATDGNHYMSLKDVGHINVSGAITRWGLKNLPENAQVLRVKGKVYRSNILAAIGTMEQNNNPLFVGLSRNLTLGAEGGWYMKSDWAGTDMSTKGLTDENFPESTWFDFDLHYDAGAGYYMLTLTNGDKQVTELLDGYYSQNGNTLASGTMLEDFLFFVYHTSDATPVLDDLEVTLYNAGYVDSVIADLPSKDSVTLQDEVEILTVQKLYDGLSKKEQRRVTEYYKLEQLITKLTELKEASVADKATKKEQLLTFEDADNLGYFERINTKKMTALSVADNPDKDGENNSEKVMAIANSYEGTETDGRSIFKYYDDIHSAETGIYSVTGKVYLNGSNTSPILVYNYESDNAWSGFMLTSTTSGITLKKLSKSAGKNVSSSNLTFSNPESLGEFETGRWVTFVLKYDLTNVTLYVAQQNKAGKTVISQYRCAIGETNLTRFAFAANTAKTAYFDDIKLCEETETYFACATFTKTHNSLLSLVPAETYVSYMDKAAYEAAMTDYNNLSASAKECLVLEKIQLDKVKNALDKIENASNAQSIIDRDNALVAKKEQAEQVSATNDDGFSGYIIEDDFENGLSKWEPEYGNGLYNTGSVTTEYNETLGSTALRLNKASVIGIKDTLLPDRSEVVSVSFKMLSTKFVNAASREHVGVFTSYKSVTSYNGFFVIPGFETSNGALYQRWYQSGGDKNQKKEDAKLNSFNSVLSVEIRYTKEAKNGVLTITDENDNVILYEITRNIDYINVLNGFFVDTYIDDFKIELCQGHYDIDQENTEITATYRGNTWLKPGETLLLSGEDIAANVVAAYIMPITDQEVSYEDYGFVDQMSFDDYGVEPDEFTKTAVDKVTVSPGATGVTRLKFVQKTEDSIKVIVPDDYEEGIYAVLLQGVSSSETYYINTPLINYTVGSDGETTAPGKDLRIIGKNLGVVGDTEKIKVLVTGVDGEKKVYHLKPSEIQSDYSLSVTLPEDIPVGTYEVSVYNGYGDATCWSIPMKFKVAEDVRASMPSQIYNVVDYGANPDSNKTNDTPAFVAALAAIAQNQGGILYIPNGTYRICSELIIPGNTQVIGESKEETSIFFEPYDYSWGELPSQTFLFTGDNIVFENITFSASRVGGVFQFTQNIKNVYISNFDFSVSVIGGTSSNAGMNYWAPSLSASALEQLSRSESVGFFVQADVTATNVQLRDVSASGITPIAGLNSMTGTSSYWQLDNYNDEVCEFAELYTSYSLIENVANEGDCFAVWGNGCYFDNFAFTGNYSNNQELWAADHGAKFGGTNVMEAKEDTEYNTVYTITGNYAQVKPLSQIYISTGQGRGQVRTITDIKATDDTTAEITLDSPFVVKPNSNSRIIIRYPREHIFFVDGYYANGSNCGLYGGGADLVYDNNEYHNVNASQNDYGGEVNWYITHNECEFVDEGTLAGGQGQVIKDFAYTICASNNSKAHTLKNCTFNQYQIKLDAHSPNFADIIIEKNQFEDTDAVVNFIYLDTATGVLLKDNSYLNVCNIVTAKYDGVYETQMNTVNTAGSKHCIIYDPVTTDKDSLLLGDVNADGEVDLKDATYIRYYVVGRLAATNYMLTAGDVNRDGNMDLKDATLIRLYHVGRLNDFEDALPPSDDEDDSNVEEEQWTDYY